MLQNLYLSILERKKSQTAIVSDFPKQQATYHGVLACQILLACAASHLPHRTRKAVEFSVFFLKFLFQRLAKSWIQPSIFTNSIGVALTQHIFHIMFVFVSFHLIFQFSTNNNKAFKSQTSWGRLELKPSRSNQGSGNSVFTTYHTSMIQQQCT